MTKSSIDSMIQKIRILVLDVDGVMTDGSIILGSNDELKSFDVQDGLGITLARLAGIKVAIITGRASEAVARRAEELHCDAVYQAAFKKAEPFQDLLDRFDLSAESVCYMGDDLLDVPVMNQAGFAVAVSNAREEVAAVADYITMAPGGRGAVREVVELILKTQKKWEETVAKLIPE